MSVPVALAFSDNIISALIGASVSIVLALIAFVQWVRSSRNEREKQQRTYILEREKQEQAHKLELQRITLEASRIQNERIAQDTLIADKFRDDILGEVGQLRKHVNDVMTTNTTLMAEKATLQAQFVAQQAQLNSLEARLAKETEEKSKLIRLAEVLREENMSQKRQIIELQTQVSELKLHLRRFEEGDQAENRTTGAVDDALDSLGTSPCELPETVRLEGHMEINP